jgi:cytochrome o ubiquinol oxidase subunit 1
MNNFIFGKLTLNALPHEWFTIGGTITLGIMLLSIVVFLIKIKRLRWLWDNWLTSTDPKKIGIMYIVMAILMLLRGGLDAGMIWLQQSMAAGNPGYLSAEHFQEIFTAHGVIMVFFVASGLLFGLLNFAIPLQIGARDLASPFLNTLGFWLYVAGAILINIFFVFGGHFSGAGWLAVAPLSGIEYSPGVGVDYWIWSLQISGIGTTIGAINFIMTILKMRAPGMTLMRMPMFTWSSLCSMFLIVAVFPILTATLALLSLDRLFGMHFFTAAMGGNAMMYTNLIWMWGHPEVYILIIPAFGIYSEIVSTFSRKSLFGYTSGVIAVIGVTALSMLVWLHHFFTMGSGANVNAFFGIMTMIIAVPTGVQFINWIFTMHKGKIRFANPMLWFLGFVATFTIGGMTGVLLAIPPADFQFHNSLFLVAHFHTQVIGGVVFGLLAGFTYWFPKATGIVLNERLGKYSFWFWFIGFWVSFGPLYILGLMGATRRLETYDAATGWQPFFILALLGFVLLSIGTVFLVLQVALQAFLFSVFF